MCGGRGEEGEIRRKGEGEISPELEGVAPLLPEHVHKLLRHPVDLGLGELDHVESHVVEEREAVGQQAGVLGKYLIVNSR